MQDIPKLVMMNGVQIPQLGFGTYKITERAVEVVASAINIGYRHLDTAQMYRNESQVGEAWATSGIARQELFITSKLDNPNHEPDDARRSFEQTLRDLRTDYVDLFLIHWPLPMHYNGDFAKTWRVLEDLYDQGACRAIGVSNFEPHHLETLFQTANLKPMVNQIESHPYLPNNTLHRFDRNHGILTEAWSPLARGRATSEPLLTQIGEARGKTAAQVAIRWGLQRGDILFPKSSTPEGQRENIEVFDFHLLPDEMAAIDALDEGEDGRTGMHPDLMDRIG